MLHRIGIIAEKLQWKYYCFTIFFHVCPLISLYCELWCSDVQKSGRSKLGTKAGLQRAISQFTQEKKTEQMKTDTGEWR